MLNFKIIFRIMGLLLFGEGIVMCIPALISLAYQEPDLYGFVISILLSLISGIGLFLVGRNAVKVIGKKDGFIIVSLTWVLISLFGALPFVLSGQIPSFTDAFFETMSGLTTTGSSILNNIEELSHGILFWRSLTQWLGGMGIIVLSLAILPLLGVGGMALFVAEVPGPTPDKLSPRVHETARKLWGIYVLFTAMETFLLKIGGMTWFDSICHSFTTMATGGYSTKQASIAYWDSPFIQYVIILFMFIAGVNFSVSYFAIVRKFDKVKSNEEFKWYTGIVLLFTAMITIGLWFTKAGSLEQSFRDSLFQVVSVVTTTGFATADYLQWHPVLIILLFTLFFLGGSAGSTGGGIKVIRILLLIKNGFSELKRMVHPNAIIPVRFNKRAVSESIIQNVLAFFFIYICILMASTTIYMFVEPDFSTALSAVATCLGNIGPGLGSVGPADNFATVHPFGKWFLSFLMLLGRLELFTVLLLFTPAFWKQ